LVIIDEAHKLYSKDLIATERPKMNIIEEKLNNSPSCKVMLMTGTPIADDPMEFFKLLNLIMKKDKFPTSFNKFREEFLMNNQFTSSGKSEFQKRTKGLISYLNRRFDPRQFTQPVFHNKPVTMSINKGDSHEDCMSNAKNTNLECIQRIIDIKETNEDLEKLIKEIDTLDKEIKTLVVESKSNKSLKDLVKLKKENYKYLKLQLKEKKNLAKIGLKNVKAEESKCKKEFTKHKKKCKEEMKKKVSMYQNDVLNKC
jgi:ATP-dependent Lon protease